ncbi:MAG: hypothetical protein WC325_09490 [Candidatus Bathyarchaeia archaeon]
MGNICGHYINESGFCKVAKQPCENVPPQQCRGIQDLTAYAEAKP